MMTTLIPANGQNRVHEYTSWAANHNERCKVKISIRLSLLSIKSDVKMKHNDEGG
jgi:hypothetical protein